MIKTVLLIFVCAVIANAINNAAVALRHPRTNSRIDRREGGPLWL